MPLLLGPDLVAQCRLAGYMKFLQHVAASARARPRDAAQANATVERIGQAASARTLDIGIGSGLSLAFYGEHTGQVVASEVGRSDVYEYSVTEQHGAAKSDDPKPGEPDVALPSHPNNDIAANLKAGGNEQ